MGMTAPRAAMAPPPVQLPGEWTFFAETIIGAMPLGPVPALNWHGDKRLSGFGKGDVTLPSRGTTALSQDRMLRLWSWKLWAYYGGRPYWCGVPTGITDEGRASTVLTLIELPGYLERRQWDVSPPRRYSQVEQTVIAADIAAPLADVGVLVETDPGPGYARDREYAYLESESRARLLENLSNVVGGPQFRTEYRVDHAGRPQCVLKIGYPRVGQATGLGLKVPGEVTGYTAKWDDDELRTRTFAVGEVQENAPEGTPTPVAMVDRPQPDLPRLDAADDNPGTFLLTTLAERADTKATQHADPALQMSATGPVHAPPITSYAPGDDVTVRVVSPLIADGIEETAQLTQMTVNANAGTVAWEIAVALPPPRTRPTLLQRLSRTEDIARAAFRTHPAPLGGNEP